MTAAVHAPSWRYFALFLIPILTLCSCAPRRQSVATERPISLGAQIIRADQELKGQRFSTLLDFESDSDRVFVTSTGQSDAAAATDRSVAHTGKSSFRIDKRGSKNRIEIKLASLLASREFPADWTLIGGYFLCDRPIIMSARCAGPGFIAARSVRLNAGVWTPVMLDLANAQRVQTLVATPPALSFTFEGGDGVPIHFDDLMLIDNAKWYVGEPQKPGDPPGEFCVRRRGLELICDRRQQFSLQLPTADASADGWRVEEANALRVRLSSNGASTRSLTLFPDGRSYWDGQFRELSSQPKAPIDWADQQDRPAKLDVPETMGRVDRRSAGDANNDGYNETTASYRIVSTGPRIDVRIIPQAPLWSAMFEIRNLPPGNVLATFDGTLLQSALRLEDGTLLVVVPFQIDRTGTLSVRVQ